MGFHFPPSEEYWVDCHNHLSSGKTHSQLYAMLNEWFARLDGFRLGKVMEIAEGTDAFNVYKDVSSQDKRFSWLLHMPFNKPDVK